MNIQMETHFEVQECEFTGWTNNWSDEEGPSKFEKMDDAIIEISTFLKNSEEAVKLGHCEDSPSKDQFRIVEIGKDGSVLNYFSADGTEFNDV